MFEDQKKVYDALATQFSTHSVLIIGDLILDRYLWGEMQRISPEAPVPVVELKRIEEKSGGAANVANNCKQLGMDVFVAGFVGSDSAQHTLLNLLQQQHINTTAIIALTDRPTITKSRIIAAHQQVLRIDEEETQLTIDPVHYAMLLSKIEQCLSQHNISVIILSDYAKGVLPSKICRHLICLAKNNQIPILVDPKGDDYTKYIGATAITPNRQELANAVNIKDHDFTTLCEAGRQLKDTLQLDFIAVTLSEQGIALLTDKVDKIPAMAKEVFDVSGAGDTVIALMAAGEACQLSRIDSAHLANLAASVVVAKVGTEPISLKALKEALNREESHDQQNKICDQQSCITLLAQWRKKGQRILFTNGCFDLLHVGHVTYLQKAKKLGHRLIIGVNSDASVQRLKGPNRPVIKQADRAQLLASLSVVDMVVIFTEDTPLNLIKLIKPNVLIKGADYTEQQVVGADLVRSMGGEIALIELVAGVSTTLVIEQLNKQ